MGKDVIIACDFDSAEKTFAFLDRFTGKKPFVKIGMELYYAEGPSIVREIKKRGHKIFLDFTELGCYADFAITTLDFSKFHFTIDFADNSRVRRVTSFKQLCNARKTTGDVTCATCSTWNLHKHLTRLQFFTVFN